jgi:uncharacterized damage-inducible protein DinB
MVPEVFNVTISQMLLPEFDQEMKSTRKLLECVPDDKLAYKPHEKSMTLGRLASHVAEMPHWAVETIGKDMLEATPGQKPFVAESKAELLSAFDKNVAEAREAIAGASDEHLSKTWKFVYAGQTAFEMPRVAVLRAPVMNHMIHHRAQLGVFLRLNNVAIPGMYGPSFDDKAGMGASA